MVFTALFRARHGADGLRHSRLKTEARQDDELQKEIGADDGNEYDAKVTVPEKDKVEVRGCAGAFCGSEIWTKTK